LPRWPDKLCVYCSELDRGTVSRCPGHPSAIAETTLRRRLQDCETGKALNGPPRECGAGLAPRNPPDSFAVHPVSGSKDSSRRAASARKAGMTGNKTATVNLGAVAVSGIRPKGQRDGVTLADVDRPFKRAQRPPYAGTGTGLMNSGETQQLNSAERPTRSAVRSTWRRATADPQAHKSRPPPRGP
jgi:hypothetical protein